MSCAVPCCAAQCRVVPRCAVLCCVVRCCALPLCVALACACGFGVRADARARLLVPFGLTSSTSTLPAPFPILQRFLRAPTAACGGPGDLPAMTGQPPLATCQPLAVTVPGVGYPPTAHGRWLLAATGADCWLVPFQTPDLGRPDAFLFFLPHEGASWPIPVPMPTPSHPQPHPHPHPRPLPPFAAQDRTSWFFSRVSLSEQVPTLYLLLRRMANHTLPSLNQAIQIHYQGLGILVPDEGRALLYALETLCRLVRCARHGEVGFSTPGGGGVSIEPPKTGRFGKRTQLTEPLISHFKLWHQRRRKSPRREVVRSSAGASVVYPPFLGSFA